MQDKKLVYMTPIFRAKDYHKYSPISVGGELQWFNRSGGKVSNVFGQIGALIETPTSILRKQG